MPEKDIEVIVISEDSGSPEVKPEDAPQLDVPFLKNVETYNSKKEIITEEVIKP